jgi:glutamyl-tRNA synthetase
MDELIEEFSLERINKAGARFDIQKAQWFNQHYLRITPKETLVSFLQEAAARQNVSCSQEKAERIISVMRERVTFPADFWEQGQYFFQAPLRFDEGILNKKWNQDVVRVVSVFKDSVGGKEAWTAEIARTTLEEVCTSLQIGTGKILQALRIALTGAAGGPDLMMIMEIIGRDEVVSRLSHALQNFKVKVA